MGRAPGKGLELEYVRGHFQTSDGSRVDRDGLSAMVFANLGRVRAPTSATRPTTRTTTSPTTKPT